MVERAHRASSKYKKLGPADLLLNHFVNDTDGIEIVFDWGNALAGDPLYDIACIPFCIPWFPTIDRQHVLEFARIHFLEANLLCLLTIGSFNRIVGV